jgi:hypothetical protein
MSEVVVVVGSVTLKCIYAKEIFMLWHGEKGDFLSEVNVGDDENERRKMMFGARKKSNRQNRAAAPRACSLHRF